MGSVIRTIESCMKGGGTFDGFGGVSRFGSEASLADGCTSIHLTYVKGFHELGLFGNMRHRPAVVVCLESVGKLYIFKYIMN